MHWTITKKKSNYTYYSQMLSTKKGLDLPPLQFLKILTVNLIIFLRQQIR